MRGIMENKVDKGMRMNVFELEVTKYERRIGRIEEAPIDTGRLRTNRMYYEIMRDFHAKVLRDVESEEPLAYHVGPAPDSVVLAMGATPIDICRLGDRFAHNAPSYIDASRGRGFDPQVCTRIANAIGVCLAEEVPRPAFTFYSGHCHYMGIASQFLAHIFNVPFFSIDMDWYTASLEEATSDYVERLNDFIESAEKSFGLKYDEDKHREIMQFRREFGRLKGEIEGELKAIPCPARVRDVQRQFLRELVDPRALDYCVELRDELRQRVANKKSPIRDEKLRLMWLQAPPIFTDVLSRYEDQGVAFPFAEVGFQNPDFAHFTEECWENDSPLKLEARWMFNGIFVPPEWRIAELIIKGCKEYCVDGVVHLLQKSCAVSNGITKIIADTVERELGIPMIGLDTDFVDVRDFSEMEYEAKMEEFIGMCLLTKGAE